MATAKPQLACLKVVPAKWILPQEKSTLQTAREGYSNCGFALGFVQAGSATSSELPTVPDLTANPDQCTECKREQQGCSSMILRKHFCQSVLRSVALWMPPMELRLLQRTSGAIAQANDSGCLWRGSEEQSARNEHDRREHGLVYLLVPPNIYRRTVCRETSIKRQPRAPEANSQLN
jgi:hypothetical protein